VSSFSPLDSRFRPSVGRDAPEARPAKLIVTQLILGFRKNFQLRLQLFFNEDSDFFVFILEKKIFSTISKFFFGFSGEIGFQRANWVTSLTLS
jgi:hypothetical protein